MPLSYKMCCSQAPKLDSVLSKVFPKNTPG